MRNHPNMSYCMCENTVAAMRQIILALEETGLKAIADHASEQEAFRSLYDLCLEFQDVFETLQDLEDDLEY